MLDGAGEHFTIIMFVLVLKHIILKRFKHIANFKHVSTRLALIKNAAVIIQFSTAKQIQPVGRHLFCCLKNSNLKITHKKASFVLQT